MPTPKPTPKPTIVALSDRPDLVPLIAQWRIAAFFDDPAWTPARYAAALLAPPNGPEEHFVLLDDGAPAGTASLTHDDLDSRPDLTPWLAGVFVLPAFRRRGHASALVRRVERFAAEHGVVDAWLYTTTAAPLYARLGWEHAADQQDGTRTVTLMRRHLAQR